MSVAERLASAPVVALAQRSLDGSEGVWIAGGAVRDAALGRDVVDLDLAVAGDPAAAAKAVAREGKGHSFELSAEFATWRAVAADGSWQIDATALRGETIEADLAGRDFTIGAVAVPICRWRADRSLRRPRRSRPAHSARGRGAQLFRRSAAPAAGGAAGGRAGV